MPRSLSGLKTDFEKGCLNPLLRRIQLDRTLTLEIRDGYIDVYYRGGCITNVRASRGGGYTFKIAKKYFDHGLSARIPPLSEVIRTEADCVAWVAELPERKDGMDLWFGLHPKNEREAQQLLSRDNNWGQSGKDSDYFVLDIEYQEPREKGRFDALAVHWPSTNHVRGDGAGRRFAFLELKWCDAALASLDGKGRPQPGIRKHVRDLEFFVRKSGKFTALKDDMVGVFNDKRDLRLMPWARCDLVSFSDEKPQLIIVLANHDPEKSMLLRELVALQNEGVDDCIELRFGRTNYFGYALYEQRLLTLNEIISDLRQDPIRRGADEEEIESTDGEEENDDSDADGTTHLA